MKLSRIRISSFGCFDSEGIEILIDNIVVLIGPNNSGKSTIMNAYEAFASLGKELPTEAFYNQSTDHPIKIEGAFTDVSGKDLDTIGKDWKHVDATLGDCVRVRWVWDKPDEKGQKQSWSPQQDKWVDGGVGGWDTLIKSRIPVPIRVSPTDTPAIQEDTIRNILTSAVKASLKKDGTKAAALFEQLEQLGSDFHAEVTEEVSKACASVQQSLTKVFPGYMVGFHQSPGKVDPEKLIGTGSYVEIEQPGSIPMRLARHGTGVQRSFLWAAITALVDLGLVKQGKTLIKADRPRILLMEEPETFLHPPLIRLACEALYSVADVDGWQVMTATHSPVFVNVSKPHTTIVRVGRSDEGPRRVFQTDQANFDADDRDRLRMIRTCDPTVAEFFFADQAFLVEGETEQVVLRILFNRHAPDMCDKVCIVNCHGKGNIPLFAKILNQFGSPYTVIHDSDSPHVISKGQSRGNAMWTINSRIYDAVSGRAAELPKSRIIVHIPDFEGYYFDKNLTDDKPYAAITELMQKDYDSKPSLGRLRDLVPNILAGTHPGNYGTAEEFEEKYRKWLAESDPSPSPTEKWSL